jgi:hypothetical protein
MLHSSETKLGQPRQVRWLALALTLATVGLGACGDDDGDENGAATTPGVDTDLPADSGEGSEEIVIKTDLTIPTGEVLEGSSIGDTPFCPGGTFRDQRGERRPLGAAIRIGGQDVSLPRRQPEDRLHPGRAAGSDADWPMEGRERDRRLGGAAGKRPDGGQVRARQRHERSRDVHRDGCPVATGSRPKRLLRQPGGFEALLAGVVALDPRYLAVGDIVPKDGGL